MGRRDAETETLIPITGAVFDVAHALSADGFDASEDGTGRGTPLVPIAFPAELSGTQCASSEQLSPALSVSHTMAVAFDTTQITSAANYSNPRPGDPSHPLAAGAHPPAVAFSIMPMNSGKDYKARPTDVAQPVMAGGPVGGNQGGDYIAEQWAVRRLTPRECERLQGFPDDWTQVPHRGRPAADGPRYKAIGNSMAVNVMRFIGERIAAVDAIARDQEEAA